MSRRSSCLVALQTTRPSPSCTLLKFGGASSDSYGNSSLVQCE